jgi:REP element-mobilizing transposase RayT
MSSTHLSLHYHIVFGTKNHEPLIQPAWRGNLHAYLGGIVRTANGIAESVGGVSDHVHLLIGLRATHCLADVLRELKAVPPVGCTNRLAFGVSRGRRVTAHLQWVLPNAKQFAITSSNKRSITARAHFAKSIWNYCAAAARSLTNVIFNTTPLPGLAIS